MLFASCKEKFNPAPVVGPASFVFRAFSVEGVSNENIQLLEYAIVIKLPADYANGNVIRPAVKLKNEFKLETDFSQGLLYLGQKIMISTISDTYGNCPYSVLVIPATAPVFKAIGKNHEAAIQSGSQLTIPVSVPGTSITADENGNIVLEPVLKITEKISGKTATWKAFFEPDGSGNSLLKMDIPSDSSAGAYEAELEWGAKKVKIPDPVVLKHGLTEIGAFSYFTKESTKIKGPGANLLAENKYELQLANYFIESKKIPLNRLDFNDLEFAVPSDLQLGNDKSTILVNGKEFDNHLFKFGGYADLYHRLSDIQPVLAIISKPSLKANSPCMFYTPAKTLSRAEKVVMFLPLAERNPFCERFGGLKSLKVEAEFPGCHIVCHCR